MERRGAGQRRPAISRYPETFMRVKRPRRALRRTALALALALALPTLAGAEEGADFDPFHWGYAPLFGSGVYRQTDGTEARILRLAPAVRLREARVRRGANVGVRLRLPFTAGVQNLDDHDLPAHRPSDEVEHAAFVPGLELEFPGERYAFRVHGYAGWGTELEGEENSAQLYGLGLRGRVDWPEAVGRPSWIGGLMWAGFDPERGERRSLLRFTQALELDVAVPRWEFKDATMHLRPHVLVDWYYRPPRALAFGDDDFAHVETEWQLGVAARREGGFKVLFVEFNAVGVAYRFSEHSAGVRFFLNSIF
jgi:hypothetical protein